MGYSIALMGIQGYSSLVISSQNVAILRSSEQGACSFVAFIDGLDLRSKEDFERGVIIGLYNKLKAPQPQPQSIGAAEEPSEDIELEIVSEGVPLVADAEGRNSEPQ